MSFTPYLNFDDTCEAAMRFYADVFGATDLMIMRFSEAPDDVGLPDNNLVMHAQFSADGHVLMASDTPPGVAFQPQASVAISHATKSVEAGRAIFDKLADGGAVIMPYEATFFSSAFGMLKDRFGTHWMIMLAEDALPEG